MKRKICIVTTSRADYGLLYPLIMEVHKDSQLRLQVVAAGMHLEKRFGLTYKQIEKDGFKIDAKVYMDMSGDTPKAVARSIAVGIDGFCKAFTLLKPDIVVILGDRYEMLPAAIMAVVNRIPVAHIHGGESTEGVIDEQVRHAVTKMASIHFTSTEIYRRRVIQMGEHPSRVFNFGAPGLDNVYAKKLLSKSELQKALNFDLSGRLAILTFHPDSIDPKISRSHIRNILTALKYFNLKAIFTMANADVTGQIINKELQMFALKNPRKYKFIKNLGSGLYLSCMKNFDLMIGNSSSGIIEAASLGLPVVNIGDRQKGRARGANVIDAGNSIAAIKKAIKSAMTDTFITKIRKSRNPYDTFRDGRASYRIKQALKRLRIDEGLLKKEFFQIKKAGKYGK